MCVYAYVWCVSSVMSVQRARCRTNRYFGQSDRWWVFMRDEIITNSACTPKAWLPECRITIHIVKDTTIVRLCAYIWLLCMQFATAVYSNIIQLGKLHHYTAVDHICRRIYMCSAMSTCILCCNNWHKTINISAERASSPSPRATP